MFEPASPPPDGSAATPARLNFLQRLETHAIRPAARDDYVRWAEAWINPAARKRLMSDDCWFLIFEVTEWRIVPLPFKNQKSTLTNHQSSPTADATTAYFGALGRSAHLADWQYPRGPEGFWTERSLQGAATGGAAESIQAGHGRGAHPSPRILRSSQIPLVLDTGLAHFPSVNTPFPQREATRRDQSRPVAE